MTLSRGLALAALAAVSLALNACGGGGNSLAGGGVSGTGITSGSITGFGSIIANERVHNTDQAVFERDGQSATQADFKVGDVVVIEWDSSDGGVTRNATRVSYQRQLFGEVTADPNTVTNEFGVLGQIVRADATTIFDNFDPIPVGAVFPPNLVQGVCVEVSGFREASGSLFATRVELEGSCPATVEIQGVVESVVGTPITQITVSGTTVDVGASTTISPSESALVQEAYVTVEGTFSGSVLTATEIVVRDDDLSELEDDDLDVEGIIDNLTVAGSIATFTVSGIPVSASDTIEFVNGDFVNLADNARAEVEGRFTGGVLVADKVKFKLDGSVELEGVLAADISSGVLTVRFGADTVSVLTDPLITQFKNDSSDPLLGIGDLRLGDFVKVTGYVDSSVVQDAVATKVELEEIMSSETERELKGPVDSASDPVIVILGVTVDTTSISDGDFEPAGRSNFFDAVTNASDPIVQTEGTDLGGGMFWEEIELED